MITPGELADGAWVRPKDWPMLAAHWLAQGMDSAELRDLAGLSAAEGDELRPSRMRDVLRSVGVPIPVETVLLERCDRALSLVQRDLDATGFGRFQFHPVNTDDWSADVRAVFRVALPEGWDVNVETLDPAAGFAELLRDAASAVTDTILELWHLAWPDCVDHDGPPLTPDVRTAGSTQPATVWWRCTRGDHLVARVGGLSSAPLGPTRPRRT